MTLANFPNHPVPQLSHLLCGSSNNSSILSGLLCIYHSAYCVFTAPVTLALTVIPSREQEAFAGVYGVRGGGPWKAATPQPLSLAIAGAPYGACVCARYLGGRIPTPESGKAQGARGGAGEWDGRRVGCKGDGSLLLKCLPKKKGPKETPWLVLTAAFWAFLTNFPAPSPYTQLTALEELVVI